MKCFNTITIFCFLTIMIVMSCTRSDSELPDRENLVNHGDKWFTAVDPFGSSSEIDGSLIKSGVASVRFTIAHRTESETWSPWVELVCDPGHTFENYTGLTITYRNETPLLVKLSQSDFGSNGNETYSHYQYALPPSEVWNEATIYFTDFTQPDWTPENSKSIPMILENINAVYLVPDLDPSKGESSLLEVRYLKLLK